MQTLTQAELLTAHGYDPLAVEYPELVVPVIAGLPQRQGDVMVVPTTPRTDPGQPLGKAVAVVRAETDSAQTHTLHGDGLWAWSPTAGTNLVQGWLTVPDGGEALLIHSGEHGAARIGPGTYEIRRQREYAGEWRRVAD